MECWCGYLSGARCRLAYGPADATATHCLLSCSSKIQIVFTFLVPAHLGSPGQRVVLTVSRLAPVKSRLVLPFVRVVNGCVCVCNLLTSNERRNCTDRDGFLSTAVDNRPNGSVELVQWQLTFTAQCHKLLTLRSRDSVVNHRLHTIMITMIITATTEKSAFYFSDSPF